MITAANNNWAKYFQHRAIKCRHEPSERKEKNEISSTDLGTVVAVQGQSECCDPINLAPRGTFFNFKWNWNTIWTRSVETSRLSVLKAFVYELVIVLQVFKASETGFVLTLHLMLLKALKAQITSRFKHFCTKK